MLQRSPSTLALVLITTLAVPGAGAATGSLGLDSLGAGAATSAEQPSTLAAAAAATGRFFGVSVTSSRLNDPAYTTIINREFSSLTPEVELRFDATEPARGEFRYAVGDRVVDYATTNGLTGHGHSLVSHDMWHISWLASLSGWALRSAVNNHITNVASYYQGKIRAWNVVTEAFTESGTRRLTPLQREAGDVWLDEAFHAARSADPSATLCYNDYFIEDFTAAKTQGVYAMVKDLKARGVPIDCIGLESHFNPGHPVPASFQRTIEEFAALGVDVQLTELDIAGSGQAQADAYAKVVNACLAVPRCTGITVWGVRDSDSWRSSETPVLFDHQGNKKPAYHAVLEALLAHSRRAGGPVA